MAAPNPLWPTRFSGQRGDDFNPLDYRKLSILSKCYRLHMSIRLRDLCPWVESWTMDCLFAGTCAPSGADDAWYETALEMDLAKLLNAALLAGEQTFSNVLIRFHWSS